jgi:chromosome segregation ATPase
MKTVWIASIAIAASGSALAQSTIYKHVDESGRITYTNRPMKGAVQMDLEPLTTIPGTPAGRLTQARAAPASDKATDAEKAEASDAKNETLAGSVRPAVATVQPVSQRTTVASVEPSMQRKRDNDRRRILEEELAQEEQSLTGARTNLTQEQLNPQLVAAVRAAQVAENPTPSQLADMRNNIDKASGRIRGLQATVAEHEKNIEALKKELGALKP